jgi:hypothetical protein
MLQFHFTLRKIVVFPLKKPILLGEWAFVSYCAEIHCAKFSASSAGILIAGIVF